MATQPKPKPRPEPDPPEPKPGEDAVDPEATEGQPPGLSLLDRVENLENRMTALEERVAAPPVKPAKRP